LQTAYERGRDDERTKTAFLSRISEKIMAPVNEIHVATEQLSLSYQSLTKPEMNRLQQQISDHSETITNLIDHTLIKSKGEKEMPEG